MAIDFPSSPSVNDTFSTGGVTYTWDGTVWASSGPVGFVQKAGDTMTGNLAVPSLNSGPLAGMRSALINGDMMVNQRQSGATLITAAAAGYHSVDRFAFNSNTTTGRVNDSSLKDYGFGAVLSASRTSGNVNVTQMIELPRNIDSSQSREGPFTQNSQWTLSFWADTLPASATVSFAKSPTATEGTDLTVEQVAGASLEVIDGPVNGYTHYKHTYTIPATLPDRDNTNGLKLLISFPSTGTAIRTTGWQLEPGPVATPFEHRPYGTELALCQRYFYKLPDDSGCSLYNPTNTGTTSLGSNSRFGYAPFAVTMRAVPSISNLVLVGATTPVTASPVTTDGARIYCDVSTTTKAEYVDTLWADAEL